MDINKLDQMYRKAITILKNVGYEAPDIKAVVFNNRFSSSTLGRFDYNTKIIEVNKKHFIYGECDSVVNTIVHEIIHAMCEPEDAHMGRWLEIAKDVGSKTKYKIEEYSQPEEYGFLSRFKKSEIPKSKTQYTYNCKYCGYVKEIKSIKEESDSFKTKHLNCWACNNKMSFVESKKIYKYL